MIKLIIFTTLMVSAMRSLAGEAADLWSLKLNPGDAALKTQLSLTRQGTLDVRLQTSKSSQLTLSTAPTASDSKPVCALTWKQAW